MSAKLRICNNLCTTLKIALWKFFWDCTVWEPTMNVTHSWRCKFYTQKMLCTFILKLNKPESSPSRCYLFHYKNFWNVQSNSINKINCWELKLGIFTIVVVSSNCSKNKVVEGISSKEEPIFNYTKTFRIHYYKKLQTTCVILFTYLLFFSIFLLF